MAHDSSAGRDQPAMHAAVVRIEPDDGVRHDTRLAVPDRAVAGARNAVRLRFWTSRRDELADGTRVRIEPSQKTARVVRIPNHIVAGDGDAPRTRTRRQHVFGDLERFG